MTSLLKNQIIKHLSKFVKNLSPDKINLSTLKGEGDLTNLELDEKVLTSLLELPSWLTLDRAWCNRVSIKIPWTKLKSVPICLSLDEVHVSMGTCPELRQPSANLKPPTYAAGWKYGFSDKVVDGVTVSVNSLIINFKSLAFEASLQFSRILLESASPTWHQHGDLRFSRLKETDLGLILLFKELQWQTLRLEARSTTGDLSLPPLRLITNQSKCRITIKKRLLDCAVIGCRLVLIMDELLWVLTDAQLSAAVLFLQSLSSLIEQDTLVNQRFKAARKLETLPEYHAQQQQQQQHRSGAPGSTQKSPSPLGRVFARYDVLETSYHFFSEKIDFHFCDDPGEGRSSHPELKDGGALQVTLSQLQLDFYPYHWAAAEAGSHRKHWVSYEEGPLSRWIEQGIDQFTKQLLHMDSPSHNKLTRSSPTPVAPMASPKTVTSTSLLHGSILHHLRQLMSTCLILRLGDFLVYRVTTAKSRQTPKEFIVGDRGRFPLPDSTPIVHMEFTQFYYPGDTEFPLPQPKCFVQLNPLQVNFDGLTILWLHTFIRGLEKTLTSRTPSTVAASDSTSQSSSVPVPQLEVRLEALMPRLIFELPGWERPRSLQLQVSRLVFSNYRSIDSGSRADLAACLEKIQGQDGSSVCGGGLCFASTFPARDDDLSPISETLLKHATQVQPTHTSVGWKRDLLWTKETAQVWFIHLDPFWADFFAASGQLSKTKPLPFIGTVPITIWIQPSPERISGLLSISSLISVQLDRAEYVFLLRVMENLKETTAFLDHQEKKFSAADSSQSMVIGAVIPQVDLSILFPPQAASALQGMDDADSPMADTESIYPDTSSMTDLAHVGRSMQGLKLRNSHSEYVVSQPTATTDVGSVNSLTEAVTIVKSQSDSMIEMSGSSDGPSGHEDSKLSGHAPATSQRFVTFADRKQPPQQSGFSSISRGLHNFMSSMDAALKSSSSHIPDDASDCYSIRSEGSSDSSDNFIVLQSEHSENHHDILGVFKPKGLLGPSSAIEVSVDPLSGVAVEDLDEVAVEVCEETPTTSDHSSAGGPPTMASFVSPRNREVAVVTMHINDLEFIQQSVGSTSSIRLQAGHLSCNECTTISHEEFQSKFASRSRGWRDVEVDAGRQPAGVTVLPLRVRMEQKMDFSPEQVDLSGSLREAVASATEAWIEASLTHLSLSLQLSSVTGLTAFIEDELAAPVVPLFINLRDIECSLIEDRPPVRVGGPPPIPAPPMVVRVKHLLVQRNHCGVISVGVNESNPNYSVTRGDSSNQDEEGTKREAALLSRIEELERENASLYQRLSNKTN